MNDRQLRYFVGVMEAGSLTSAAESLGVAQPALGLQIRALEADLGLPLLVRHSRGVEPTAAGELLYRHALDILKSLEDARREVTALVGGARETVRFGLTPSLMRLVGPNIVLEAREMMPDVFFSLTEELSFVLDTALEADELDAAFTYKQGNRSLLSQTALMEEDLLLVSSPETEQGDGPVPFVEAVQRDLVLAGERDVVRILVEETANRLSLRPNVVYETQSVPATRNLISKGIASGIMPYGSAAEEIESGILIGRRIVEPTVTRTLSFVRRRRAQPLQHDKEFALFLRQVLDRIRIRLGDLARPLGDL